MKRIEKRDTEKVHGTNDFKTRFRRAQCFKTGNSWPKLIITRLHTMIIKKVFGQDF